MGITDFNLEAYYDNETLDEIEIEEWREQRKMLATALEAGKALPLPDEDQAKVKVIQERSNMFDALRLLNTKIKALEYLPIETVNLEDIPIIDRRWLFHPWIPEGEVTLCTGQGGVGKSFLFLQFAHMLAAGYSDENLSDGEQHYHYFLQPNLKPDCWGDGKSVVYASYEDNVNEIKRRQNTIFSTFEWAEDRAKSIYGNFHPAPMRQLGPLWGPEHGRHIQTRSQALEAAIRLKKTCKVKEAKLLILDPLSAGFYGDENSKAEAYAFINFWSAWAEETGTAVLIGAHLPKGRESRRSGYSGTAAWEGAVRSLFTLDRFDINEDEDGERKKDGNKNCPRRWYYAILGIKGNYALTAGREIPIVRGEHGTIHHTGEQTPVKEQEKAHEFYAKSKEQIPAPTDEEDNDDDDSEPTVNFNIQ